MAEKRTRDDFFLWADSQHLIPYEHQKIEVGLLYLWLNEHTDWWIFSKTKRFYGTDFVLYSIALKEPVTSSREMIHLKIIKKRCRTRMMLVNLRDPNSYFQLPRMDPEWGRADPTLPIPSMQSGLPTSRHEIPLDLKHTLWEWRKFLKQARRQIKVSWTTTGTAIFCKAIHYLTSSCVGNSDVLIAVRSSVSIVERLRYGKDVITIDIPIATISLSGMEPCSSAGVGNPLVKFDGLTCRCAQSQEKVGENRQDEQEGARHHLKSSKLWGVR